VSPKGNKQSENAAVHYGRQHSFGMLIFHHLPLFVLFNGTVSVPGSVVETNLAASAATYFLP
jgi:hypothetical protein